MPPASCMTGTTVPWGLMRTLREDQSRPSRTALAVAVGRAIGHRRLYDPMVARLLPTPERLLVARARPLASRRVTADVVALASGGLTVHAALRMAAIDDVVEQAVDDGCTQVVVVGAGLDTRAWRLHALQATTVWEVDLPGTQAAKRRGPSRAGLDADRARLVAADLAAVTLQQVLAAAGHVTDRPTMWVWEAVAPYLPPDAVTATMTAMGARSAPGSRVAMTFAHPDLVGSGPVARAMSPVTGPLARFAFKALGEPILSTHDEWDITSLAESCGFIDAQVTTHTDWAASVAGPSHLDPAHAEMLLTAGT